MPALYPLFFNNLQDNIPSVRQGAALALVNVVKAYGKRVLFCLIALVCIISVVLISPYIFVDSVVSFVSCILGPR